MAYKSAGPRQRKLQLWISDSLFERVKARADSEGDTMSEVVRRLLSIYAEPPDAEPIHVRESLARVLERLEVLEGQVSA